MELIEIIKQQAEFSRNSYAEVTIDRCMPWVTIEDTTAHDEAIFLQGEDAEEFLARLDELENECPEADRDDIELSLAYSYIENLWS